MSERLGIEFKQYRRKQIAELADWHPGFDMVGVSISDADKAAGSPKVGDKIARNPVNHADVWLVAAEYFAANFEPVRSLPDPGEGEPDSVPCYEETDRPHKEYIAYAESLATRLAASEARVKYWEQRDDSKIRRLEAELARVRGEYDWAIKQGNIWQERALSPKATEDK